MYASRSLARFAQVMCFCPSPPLLIFACFFFVSLRLLSPPHGTNSPVARALPAQLKRGSGVDSCSGGRCWFGTRISFCVCLSSPPPLMLLRRTATALRYRTAWRELLHPLPVKARRAEWLKRDAVEQNEALLRRPYYTLKSYALPPVVGRQPPAAAAAAAASSAGVEDALRQPRRATSPERLQELREQLQFPGAVGPQLQAVSSVGRPTESYTEAYGARLRPRYPESWDTVPPHQPSRGML
ncbi:uncharacterized protein Tco025E_01764 [Trypanosoma conorhini]|uniref:Uncharacterized protein n=1 Tax=Trypanosoma conorhini TaxID=83891 RepID=A0A422Q7Q4_9TRYP|nr:uncharacterized protein Tco025E_01764 [Trypanosoma conorhini]RNF26015.1 hypothetical protein Tco025E_01764 [Trypanosoma conorhini]